MGEHPESKAAEGFYQADVSPSRYILHFSHLARRRSVVGFEIVVHQTRAEDTGGEEDAEGEDADVEAVEVPQ